MSERLGETPDWTITGEEERAMLELADLQQSDPGLYEQVISAKSEQERREEEGKAILGALENAGRQRVERDQELLDAVFRVPSSAGEASEESAPDET